MYDKNKLLRLDFGEYYHIYNRGNNYESIFIEDKNYNYFLTQYQKHLLPITDLYAYCLIPNHFHFLIRVKTLDELLPFKTDLEKLDDQSKTHLFISRKFSNFFNAYSKAINKAYTRRGSLFQERFGRIKIDTDDYFTRLVYYIHTNPVKHGLVKDFKQYPYSSYQIITSKEASYIRKDEVLKLFGGLKEFIDFHDVEQDIIGFETNEI